MSKAFTKDDDGAADAPVRAALRTGGRRPITPEGHRRLTADLQALEAQRSDLKASADAPAVIQLQLKEVEAKLAQLRATLELVDVTEPIVDPEGRALFGSSVEVEDEDGAVTTYRLVGPDEADAKSGSVSIHGPLGRALLGRRAGDVITFERPRGETELTLRRVS